MTDRTPTFNRRSLLAVGAAGWAGLQARPAFAFDSGWTRRADAPGVVQEIYPAVLENRVYVVGGLTPQAPESQQNISRRVFIYDVDADVWVEGPAFPEPRHHPFAVAVERRVFAFGGYSADFGGRWSSRATTHVLDTDSLDDGWREAAPMPAPQAETVGGVLNGRIHLVGGRRPAGARNAEWLDHADVTSHQIYDPAADSWDIGLPASTARNSAASVVIDGRLHVVGGRTVSGGNTPAHEVLSVDVDGPGPGMRWDKAAPMPKAQGGLAAATLGGKLYAFGGEFFAPGGGGGVFADAWVYDPAADAWEALAPMPTPRHGLGAVTVGDAIYTIAGAAQVGGADTTAIVEAYRP